MCAGLSRMSRLLRCAFTTALMSAADLPTLRLSHHSSTGISPVRAQVSQSVQSLLLSLHFWANWSAPQVSRK